MICSIYYLSYFIISINVLIKSSNAFYTTNSDIIKRLGSELRELSSKDKSAGSCVCSGTSTYCICNLKDGSPGGSNVTTLTPLAFAAYEYILGSSGSGPAATSDGRFLDEVVYEYDVYEPRRKRHKRQVVVAGEGGDATETADANPYLDGNEPGYFKEKLGNLSKEHPFVTANAGYASLSDIQKPKEMGLELRLVTKGGKDMKLKPSSEVHNFEPLQKLFVIIPGFASSVQDAEYVDMKNKLMSYATQRDVGVLLVEWQNGEKPSYKRSIMNTMFVGRYLTVILERLASRDKIKPENIHLIGFNIGSYVASEAGFHYNRLSGLPVPYQRYGRITALDPPAIFVPKEYVLKGSAAFVDVIHSSATRNHLLPKDKPEATDFMDMLKGQVGRRDPIGNIDFRPNGGSRQPDCPDFGASLCNHMSAMKYFLKSLDRESPNGDFTSVPCVDYASMRECQKILEDDKASSFASTMGIKAEQNCGRGNHYLRYPPAQPFSFVGSNEDNERRRRKRNANATSDAEKKKRDVIVETMDTPLESLPSVDYEESGMVSDVGTYQLPGPIVGVDHIIEAPYADDHLFLLPQQPRVTLYRAAVATEDTVKPALENRPKATKMLNGASCGEYSSDLKQIALKKVDDKKKEAAARRRSLRQVDEFEYEEDDYGDNIGRQGEVVVTDTVTDPVVTIAPPPPKPVVVATEEPTVVVEPDTVGPGPIEPPPPPVVVPKIDDISRFEDVPIPPKDFQWIVSITEDSSRFVCSGTVISSQGWVLTAASCFAGRPDGWFFEVNFDSNIWADDKKSVTVKKTDGGRSGSILIHEDYTFCGHGNNIALVDVRKKYDGSTGITSGLKNVCIYGAPLNDPDHADHFKYDDTSEVVEIIGYGSLGHLDMSQNIKLYYEYNTVGQNYQCGRQSSDPRGQFCTFIPDNHCSYDSGSPVLVKGRKYYELVGVVSHIPDSTPGCVAGSPVIHTRVDKYMEWIREKIGDPDS